MIGLGPGRAGTMTGDARAALAAAEVVVGYKTYLALAGDLIEGKEIISSTMTKELDRAAAAVEAALEGRTVALISSGDPGIYAMSPVVFELIKAQGIDLGPKDLEVEIVPGVAAVTAAASLLGAPLSHDFACISLSDRLTPWEVIEKRLDAAAGADFVIALYNPKSRGRDWQYGKALEIIGRHRGTDTPVGVVGRAMREGQTVRIHDLGAAAQAEVDMQTLVIIGNSNSFRLGDRLVTPRGYMNKYGNKWQGEEG